MGIEWDLPAARKISPRSMPAPSPHVRSSNQMIWLQRTAGNQAVSRALARSTLITPAADRIGMLTLQRLTLVPFATADDKLTKFAGMQGQYLASKNPTTKVGRNEPILVIGHGNGMTISNYEDEEHGGKLYVSMQPQGLSEILKKILPKNYKGTITIWACQAAQPWRHIPGIRIQVTARDAAMLDYTFISILHQYLEFLRPDQIKGPIGFATLDRPAEHGKVYSDEKLKFLSNTLDADKGGLATVGAPANTKFYAEEDSESSEGEEYHESSEEERPADSEGEEKQSPATSDMEMDTEYDAPSTRSKKELALESIVSPTPFGLSSRPRSMRERILFGRRKK